MNPSFDDMVAELAAAITPHPGWDAIPTSTAAMAAYHKMKEKQRMSKTDPSALADHNVLAGVNACFLASLALQIEFGDPGSVRARLTVAAAHNVLRHWGVALEDTPVDDPTTHEPAAPGKPDVLVWPPVDRLGRPLTTTLPDVYRENYYHARETTVVPNPDGFSGMSVQPGHALVLLEAYWNEEALQWRMRFSNISLPMEKFWLNHCQVKTGDEIPKVIDAATQARSNDP